MDFPLQICTPEFMWIDFQLIMLCRRTAIEAEHARNPGLLESCEPGPCSAAKVDNRTYIANQLHDDGNDDPRTARGTIDLLCKKDLVVDDLQIIAHDRLHTPSVQSETRSMTS